MRNSDYFKFHYKNYKILLFITKSDDFVAFFNLFSIFFQVFIGFIRILSGFVIFLYPWLAGYFHRIVMFLFIVRFYRGFMIFQFVLFLKVNYCLVGRECLESRVGFLIYLLDGKMWSLGWKGNHLFMKFGLAIYFGWVDLNFKKLDMKLACEC